MKFAPNLHFMYPEHDFRDRFAAARADGFDAVEICFAYDVGLDEVRRALADAGQRLISFNFPAGELVPGEKRGVACLPGRETEYRAQIDEGLEWAAALDCPRGISPLSGNIPEGADRVDCEAVYVANLRDAAPKAEAAGVTLLVEPNNTEDQPGYFLRYLDEARRAVDAVNSAKVRMLFDSYHTQIMEGNLTARFRAHRNVIAHVQVGNVPGRHEPDRGEIDHRFLFAEMAACGYDGWIAGEYIPAGATTEGLGWLDRWDLR
ncbi:MAG: TIM barrel protein [Alphaproteobacteria bacterium]|nr:TIM barrel protein [Alphaproteobacteria bacterium]